MAEPANGRITVSEDKLDAKLAQLELNLVDRITRALDSKADQEYVQQLHARIHTAEATLQATALLVPAFKEKSDDVEKRLRVLERFRYAMPSAAVISTVAAIAAAFFTYFR